MSMDPRLCEIDGLRSQADRAVREAAACRELAGEIKQRRRMLATRLDPCRHRHRPEVWSSQAADASRAMLVGGIASYLAAAREDLLGTGVALLRRADVLEHEARADRRRAEELERQATIVALGG